MKNQDYGFLIQVLARNINQYFTKIGLELELSGMEIVILNFFFDNYKNTVYQTDLEQEFNIRSSTATANIKLLVKKGLLEQTADPDDKRRKQLKLTTQSQKLKTQIGRSKHELEKILVTGMGQQQKELFLMSLKMAIKNLHDINDEGRI